MVAVYAVTWLIITADAQISNNLGDTIVVYSWPVYLTNWTYSLLTLYLLVHLFATITYMCQRRGLICRKLTAENHRALFHEIDRSHQSLWHESYEDMPGNTDFRNQLSVGDEVHVRSGGVPWYFKLVWVLMNMASAGAVMVTVVFFVFLWPQFDESGIDMMNLQLHGINSVIIIIEHLLTGLPVRLLHMIYPILYGLTYLIFSAIFYGAGNSEPIYPKVLDWSHAGQTMLMVLLVGFVFIPLLQIIFYIIYKIRMCIFDSCSCIE